ncbi:PIG-H family GPI synthesis protein [Aspergillus clavatus NRRL 1]|uniref:Phosphatidylinositol N-acetylglucosaminyltransferase subunit H conserved domain-containing protein n=1 Tax=Aspergillus clavatus (strain ATCC 1007 / CBS 513.65 / DSM 816 / NCTC 3887 / NRRL 1 / QM 1276 / 107) TaxID=344612 RepID=A1CL66_ASPCL|nr:uncharacterized protein ACLA_041060 [Aspergillus clavatus NRRL 1]EAW09890.1 hypothetical protein ACLA_041060 [Aspergillus clavatus NRRL 1]
MPVRLILRRPSPTTVSFTVSNASKHPSTPAKLLFYLQILLRALVFFCVVLCDIAKARHTFFDKDGSVVRWTAVWSSPVGQFLGRNVDAYNSVAVALVSSSPLWPFHDGPRLMPLNRGAEESLLVIRGLGIQTSTSSATYLSKAVTRFIPTAQIQDIVIHEAFKGFEVRFYLAVIVEGEPDVVVVFPVRFLVSGELVQADEWRPETFTEARDLGGGLERLSTLFV